MSDVRKLETFEDHLRAELLSGTQFLEVTTSEEQRCLQVIHQLAVSLLPYPGESSWRVVEYDILSGFLAPAGHPMHGEGREDPVSALRLLLDPRWDTPDSDKQFTCKSRAAGKVQAINHSEDGRLVVLVGDEEHLLPLDAGVIVRPGQKIALGENLAGPASKHILFVFKDLGLFFNDEGGFGSRRAMRNLFEIQALSNDLVTRPVLFLGAIGLNHPEINHALVPLRFAMPDEEQLTSAVDIVTQGLPGDAGDITAEFRRKLARALTGFSQIEAVGRLAKVSWVHGGFHHPDKQAEVESMVLREIHLSQQELWRKEELLDLMDLSDIQGFDEMGGYDIWREWIEQRKSCYLPEARQAGIPRPKGAVLAGCAGTGKSRMAMITAAVLELPLLIFKFDRVFSSLVGDSEARLEHALGRIVSKGPCVLLIDEADKAFSGLVGGSQGDSGVGSRVFGKFLSWQANENKEAFVILTLNRTEGIPSELVRRGRMDEVFFVDLPDQIEREEILNIHLARRGIEPSVVLRPNQLDVILKRTEGFSGSEIEQAIIDAQIMAFARKPSADARPNFDDLRTAVEAVKPLSKLDQMGVQAIREFFQGRARPVSKAKSQARRSQVKPQRSIKLSGN